MKVFLSLRCNAYHLQRSSLCYDAPTCTLYCRTVFLKSGAFLFFVHGNLNYCQGLLFSIIVLENFIFPIEMSFVITPGAGCTRTVCTDSLKLWKRTGVFFPPNLQLPNLCQLVPWTSVHGWQHWSPVRFSSVVAHPCQGLMSGACWDAF